jgi:hypothetical protein
LPEDLSDPVDFYSQGVHRLAEFARQLSMVFDLG